MHERHGGSALGDDPRCAARRHFFAGSAVAFVKLIVSHIRDPQQRIEYLLQAAVFSGVSIPLILAAWGSFAYWKRESKPFAIGLTLTLIGEIMFLGWLL
jgi:hypothetical protein